MLTFGEMSGYDLWKLADRSIRFFFWNPAKSQVYGELRRLASLGYADQRQVRQEGRPDKRIYRITPEGERALEEWLNRPEVEAEQVRSPFLLKVFLGAHMDPQALARQVEECGRQARQTVARLEEAERTLAGQPEWFHPYLTLLAGLAHGRATAAWAERVLELLEERGAA